VKEGRIICAAEVVHRMRRSATIEAKVSDGEGKFMASGTGTFRIYEKRGAPIV
jgi:acyl-coenzyme A thioesterase PaaI-like protein